MLVGREPFGTGKSDFQVLTERNIKKNKGLERDFSPGCSFFSQLCNLLMNLTRCCVCALAPNQSLPSQDHTAVTAD